MDKKDKSVKGITVVKPTGNVLEGTPLFVEVEFPDTDYLGNYQPFYRYARLNLPFGFLAAPSADFIQKYADEIFLNVIFEKGNPDYPIVIGYTPRQDNFTDTPDNFPNAQIYRTTKFFVSIDDDAEELLVTFRPDTEYQQTFKIDSSLTTLGLNSASKQPAALGQTTVDLLNRLLNAIQDMIFVTPSGNTSTLLNLQKFKDIQNDLDTLLSNSVQLD